MVEPIPNLVNALRLHPMTKQTVRKRRIEDGERRHVHEGHKILFLSNN
jgi:hypothetical protein